MLQLPILILGYERSGTTLLRRLVSMHPDIKSGLVHENQMKLLKSTSKEDAIKKLGPQLLSGQKVAYTSFKRVRGVTQKFFTYFPTTRILHINRNYIDCIRSQNKTFKKNIKRCKEDYFNSVPKVREHIKKFEGTKEIYYEELVFHPFEVVTKLYKWMGGSEVKEEHIRKVISTRKSWTTKEGHHMSGLRYFDTITSKKVSQEGIEEWKKTRGKQWI